MSATARRGFRRRFQAGVRLVAAVLVTSLLAGVGAGVGLAACGGDDGTAADDAEEARPRPTTSTTTTPTTAPTTTTVPTTTTTQPPPQLPPDTSFVATAKDQLSQIQVFDAPRGRVIHTLANPKEIDVADPSITSPVAFLVDAPHHVAPRDVPNREWLRVHLPVPPNDARGYVRARDVDVTRHAFRIVIDRQTHTLTLTEEGNTLGTFTIGLGRAGRDTRPGHYYITELIEAQDPSGPYGPFAYGISGFPEDPAVIADFGSTATIGIHGTNNPASIGDSQSNGCIRMSNEDVSRLAGVLPLGTPVDVY